MAARSEAKRYGLRLALPGAPNTPHTVAGLQGYYWPSMATPVGAPGELPLEVARKAAADEGVHLELVEITEAQAQQAIATLAQFRKDNGRHLAEAVKAGGAEGQIARDEIAQTRGAALVAAAEHEED